MNDKERHNWLMERKKRIQASEVAAILGQDTRRGPIDVYIDKTTDEVNEGDEIWLAYGRDIEGGIANAYAYHTKRQVQDLGVTEIQVHPDIPWLGATLDRVWLDYEGSSHGEELTDASQHPLELKSVAIPGMTPDRWTDDPPTNYLIQLQTQMACVGASMGSLAGMFTGYRLAHSDHHFDKEFLELAYPILDEFWQRVQRRDPPPLDSQPVHKLDAVKRLWSRENGETVLLTEDDLKLVEAWEIAKAESRDAGKEAKDLQAKIWDRIGEATFGALPDGTMIALKTQSRKEHTVKASEFRVMRRLKAKGK